jgi:hypothetical protein
MNENASTSSTVGPEMVFRKRSKPSSLNFNVDIKSVAEVLHEIPLKPVIDVRDVDIITKRVCKQLSIHDLSSLEVQLGTIIGRNNIGCSN